MREAAGDVIREPCVSERRTDTVQPLGTRCTEIIHDEPLPDNLPDRHARVERGERVLKHDLHPRSQRPHLVTVLVVYRHIVEQDFATVLIDQTASACPNVVLPEPDSPTSPSVSCRRRCKDRLSTAIRS